MLGSPFFISSGSHIQASTEIDRRYKLETLGFLRSWDNVDGLFTQYVQSAYDHFTNHQSRFSIVDLSKIELLLESSHLDYQKVVNDLDILKSIAKNRQIESFVRTKIFRVKQKYEFTLEWIHAPHMEILSSLTFTLEEPKLGEGFKGEQIAETLEANLQQLFLKIPFFGHLTGKDGKSVTLNIGSRATLKEGDILWIGTLDQVKIHPLLNTVVDWKMERTGRVQVRNLEEDLAFCDIIDEESGLEILPLQKVIHIERHDLKTLIDSATDRTNQKKIELEKVVPTLGWISASLPIGAYTRDFSLNSSAASYSGGGFAYGGQAETEIWLTREWFGSLTAGYSAWHFNQKNMLSGVNSISTQNGGVQGSLFNLQMSIGYTHLFKDNFYGPKGWIKAGYKSDSYQLPSSPVDYTNPISFNSVFAGVGGNFPLKNGDWEITGFLNFRLFPIINGTYTNGQKLTADTSSDIQFYLGFIYHLGSNLGLKAGCEMLATTASFSNGTNLSQKHVTFQPALVYYF